MMTVDKLNKNGSVNVEHNNTLVPIGQSIIAVICTLTPAVNHRCQKPTAQAKAHVIIPFCFKFSQISVPRPLWGKKLYVDVIEITFLLLMRSNVS